MIIIKMKVNRQITSDYWKQMAIGVKDEYGNPFRVIKLRWNANRLHKMAEYVKTRGFEDAIVSSEPRTGGLKITYRKNGSIMWNRMGGIGPFTGELPYTIFNMNKLASHYGDRLWTIIDGDIDIQVKAMYEKRMKEMAPELRKFNTERQRRMHISAVEATDGGNQAPQIPLEAEKLNVEEKNRLNIIKEQDLQKRKAALDLQEDTLNKKVAGLIGANVDPVVYQPEFLETQKLYQLRGLCKQLKIKWLDTDTKENLKKKIQDKQAGDAQKVKEKVDAAIGNSLDD